MRLGLLLLLLLWAPSLLGAADKDLRQGRLVAEKKDLAQLIRQSRQKEWGVLETLKALDKNLGKKRRELRNLKASVQELKTSVALLDRQIKKRQTGLVKDLDRLDRQMRALFYIQKVRHLTLFPGLSSYENYFRNQRLLQRLSEVDAQLVAQVAIDLREQQEQREMLFKKSERLGELLGDLQRQKVTLAMELRQQKDYLRHLRSDRNLRRKLLKEADRELERLNRVVEAVVPASASAGEAEEASPKTETAAPQRPQVVPYSGLRSLKGWLEPPVPGELITKFRQKQKFNGLYKKGVLVRTTEDAKPKAVALGKVVFAGNFRGFGSMVILDHGRGSFSVYGNLEEAGVEKGAEVKEGQELGQVAFSSGDEEGYLFYFEVRHRKRSTDPLTWLKENSWD